MSSWPYKYLLAYLIFNVYLNDRNQQHWKRHKFQLLPLILPPAFSKRCADVTDERTRERKKWAEC